MSIRSSSSAAVRHPGAIIAVLGFCGIVTALMQTLVLPLVASLPRLLDTSASNASWVITSTLLAGAVIVPISGRLGDMFGKRRMLVISLGVLSAGSVLCALTSSLVLMVAGRVLQGAAMGAIPLGISIVRDELPKERVGSAVAAISATLGVGAAIGLPVSALIAQGGGWHMVFWASAALGLVALALVVRLLPESSVRTPARFDALGALGLAMGLMALLLAITEGASWGWTSALTLGCFGASVVVLLVWAAIELRTTAPLADLRVTARPQVLFTNLASIMVGFSMFGMSLVFIQLLMEPGATGYGLAQSMVGAGLELAPGGIVMMLLAPVSALISARRGPRVTLMVGTLVMGAGFAVAFQLTAAVWQVMLACMIIGAGVGISFAAMPALILGAVPLTQTAAANGLNSLMRSIGTSTSAAVMGTVLAHMTMKLGPVTLPSMGAFHAAFLISIAGAALAFLLTAAIPGRVPATLPSSLPPAQAAHDGYAVPGHQPLRGA
ncbi:MAG: MFS transporter [Candidatus Dormibacteria bacterium]|jgi:MFS family permease